MDQADIAHILDAAKQDADFYKRALAIIKKAARIYDWNHDESDSARREYDWMAEDAKVLIKDIEAAKDWNLRLQSL